MKRCTSRSMSRRKWNISFFEVFSTISLFLISFFSIVSLFLSNTLVLDDLSIEYPRVIWSRWYTLCEIGGLVCRKSNGNRVQRRSFWIVCVLFYLQASLSFQLSSRKYIPNCSKLWKLLLDLTKWKLLIDIWWFTVRNFLLFERKVFLQVLDKFITKF